MTYLMFLILFIIPLVIFGYAYYRKNNSPSKILIKEAATLLSIIALIYTTPWDNYLVKTGVWSYDDKNILFRIGYVPFEEYCFFILQTWMTSFWCLFVLNKFKLVDELSKNIYKHLISFILIVIFVFSIMMFSETKTKYLSLILSWATPVLILQWLVGGQYLIRNIKVFLYCIFPPTIYLWIVDGYAISMNIWNISDLQTIGLKLSALPLEEAVFFLVTNLMLCQGIILYVLLKSRFVEFIKNRGK